MLDSTSGTVQVTLQHVYRWNRHITHKFSTKQITKGITSTSNNFYHDIRHFISQIKPVVLSRTKKRNVTSNIRLEPTSPFSIYSKTTWWDSFDNFAKFFFTKVLSKSFWAVLATQPKPATDWLVGLLVMIRWLAITVYCEAYHLADNVRHCCQGQKDEVFIAQLKHQRMLWDPSDHCWSISRRCDPSDHSWAISRRCGTHLIIAGAPADAVGPIWSPADAVGPIWSLLEHQRMLWDPSDHCWSTSGCCGTHLITAGASADAVGPIWAAGAETEAGMCLVANCPAKIWAQIACCFHSQEPKWSKMSLTSETLPGWKSYINNRLWTLRTSLVAAWNKPLHLRSYTFYSMYFGENSPEILIWRIWYL